MTAALRSDLLAGDRPLSLLCRPGTTGEASVDAVAPVHMCWRLHVLCNNSVRKNVSSVVEGIIFVGKLSILCDMEGAELMPVRAAEAEWKGNLIEGKGQVKLGSGAFTGSYDWRSRSADGPGTNPEELIGAAHAGCYSMALSAQLSQAGFTPTRIHTVAKVHLDKSGDGFAISQIELETEVEAPGLDADAFQTQAETAKRNCPVSKALAGTEIHLKATLV